MATIPSERITDTVVAWTGGVWNRPNYEDEGTPIPEADLKDTEGAVSWNGVLQALDTINALRPGFTVTTKTDTNWSADTDNRIYLATATGADRTCTLPAASGNIGLRHIIKATNVDPANGYEIVVDGNGAETIDGASDLRLYIDNDWVEVACDGSNWHIIADGRQAHVCAMRRAAAESMTTGATTTVTLDTEDADNANIGDTTGGDITIKRAGNYHVTFSAALPGLDDGESMRGYAYVDATATLFEQDFSPAADKTLAVSGSGVLALSAGEVLTLRLFHNEGANQNTITNLEQQPKLSVREILK